MPFHEIGCKRALHPIKKPLPYRWDLNIYRGCGHGCLYCYGRGSHRHLAGSFDGDIYVKTDVHAALERELASGNWRREIVNIGGVTDSYQPAEADHRLMPDVLRLLIRYKTPAIISTKSDLILRDYDLIAKLARLTYVNIAFTVTTMEESLRMEVEPGAATSAKRLAALAAFRSGDISTGLHMMPILPFLGDSFENLDEILGRGKDAGVRYVLPGVLYLRGPSRLLMLDYMEREHPRHFPAFQNLYRNREAMQAYRRRLDPLVRDGMEHYGLSADFGRPLREKLAAIDGRQLAWFEEER